MSAIHATGYPKARSFPNGGAAAAVLAAGLGSFLVSVFAILADKIAAVKAVMVFYKPTGPLSGVTTCAIVGWLLVWLVLHMLWRSRMVDMGRIRTVALVLLILSVLLTFPPVADLL
jgi:hypothetical protein